MLTLIETEQFEDDGETTVTKNYSCDFTVETTGDGLWGCLAGRKVRVTGITVIDEDWGEDGTYTSVNVTHDSTWDIYTDSGFEAAISEVLGYEVSFTEQGMQEDGMASMEC